MRPTSLCGALAPARIRRPSYHLDPMTGKPAAPSRPAPDPVPEGSGSFDVLVLPDGYVGFLMTHRGRRTMIAFDADTAARIRGQIEACEARAREMQACQAGPVPDGGPDHARRIEIE